MDLKQTVKDELKRRGWSFYRLAQEVKAEVPASTLYAWLGDPESTLNSGHLQHVLAALDMVVVVKVRALRKGR